MQTAVSSELKDFALDALIKAGTEPEQAELVSEGLVQTSLRGVDSHGINLLPHYIKAVMGKRINPNPKYTYTKTAPSTIKMDANEGFGIAAATHAMQKAIELAKETGIGAVAVSNSSHFGAAALFSLKAAREGCVGLSFTHSDAFIIPYGAKKPFLGTNPICFAAPCLEKEPFCLDMATSTVPWNKIRNYKDANKPLKPGWAVDSDGNQTLDPTKAIGLSPLGGYKGYGLALMVEVFCSMFTGMAYGPHINKMFSDNLSKPRKLGHFFMAINISKFEEEDAFKKRLQNMMDELRAMEPKEGKNPVLVPNDPQKSAFKIRLKQGIPISSALLDRFKEIANILDMREQRYSFLR